MLMYEHWVTYAKSHKPKELTASQPLKGEKNEHRLSDASGTGNSRVKGFLSGATHKDLYSAHP